MEILGGKERRRRWHLEDKLRIVADSHEPGASVRAVAARNDLYLPWRPTPLQRKLALQEPHLIPRPEPHPLGLPRRVHRHLPRAAPPDSWRSLRGARVPPVHCLDKPSEHTKGVNIGRRSGGKIARRSTGC
jgi:hypothetical protein